MLSPGDIAPDFRKVDCQGREVQLSSLRGRRVVLFFFPKAFTSGCTEEVRHFRDNHARITGLGAVLMGASVDPASTQCEFARQEALEFHLFSDSDHTLSNAFGVLWPVLRIDRRATFIIGKTGVIEAVIHHERRVSRHLDDVLAHLETSVRVA